MSLKDELNLDLVLKASPDSVAITDLTGKVVLVSDASLAMFGYNSRDKYTEMSITDFIVPEDRQKAKKNIELMFRGTMSGLGEYRGLRKDGATFDIEVNKHLIMTIDQKPIAIIFIVRDITDRKKIEKLLKDSEEKYRLIAENTSDGIIIFDANNKVSYVSPGYIKAFGYSETEELSKSTDDIASIIHPDDQKKIFADIFQAIKDHQPTLLYSYRMKTKKGDYLWREDNANFKYAKDGKFLGSYVVCRDITARKKIEEDLRNKVEELNKTNTYMIDRELKMVELKGEISKLKQKSK